MWQCDGSRHPVLWRYDSCVWSLTTIDGVSAVGAAAILAAGRRPGALRLRPHLGQARPAVRANESGTFAGTTKVSGRGRPALRTAAWRAVWGALPNNAVYTARYHHLTGRATNPLKDGQARAAIAGALLRQLFVVVTRRVAGTR